MSEKTHQLTYKEEKNIIIYLSDIYRKAEILCEMYMTHENMDRNLVQYNHQSGLIQLIDQTLARCTAPTRFIITHNYILRDGPNWYVPYYSKSSYYRLKKIAVHEFNEIFNMLKD